MNRKEIDKVVKEKCSNRLIGFETLEEDAQLIADVIKVVFNNDFTISYAQGILSDAQKLLPMIAKI